MHCHWWLSVECAGSTWGVNSNHLIDTHQNGLNHLYADGWERVRLIPRCRALVYILWINYVLLVISDLINLSNGLQWLPFDHKQNRISTITISKRHTYSSCSDVKFLNTPSSSPVRGLPSRLLHVWLWCSSIDRSIYWLIANLQASQLRKAIQAVRRYLGEEVVV